MSRFKANAVWFRQQTQKIPVIVFDHVNFLEAEDLELLQSEAKSAADANRFVTVFVSSDGKAPAQLTSNLLCFFFVFSMRIIYRVIENSAYSRGETYRIGDVSRDQAFEYLKALGLKDTNVEQFPSLYSQIFDLVGGRPQKLKLLVKKLLNGKSFEGKYLLVSGIDEIFSISIQMQKGRCFRTLKTCYRLMTMSP